MLNVYDLNYNQQTFVKDNIQRQVFSTALGFGLNIGSEFLTVQGLYTMQTGYGGGKSKGHIFSKFLSKWFGFNKTKNLPMDFYKNEFTRINTLFSAVEPQLDLDIIRIPTAPLLSTAHYEQLLYETFENMKAANVVTKRELQKSGLFKRQKLLSKVLGKREGTRFLGYGLLRSQGIILHAQNQAAFILSLQQGGGALLKGFQVYRESYYRKKYYRQLGSAFPNGVLSVSPYQNTVTKQEQYVLNNQIERSKYIRMVINDQGVFSNNPYSSYYA